MDTVMRCVLTFDTSLDTRRTMSISDPQHDLDSSTVGHAAESIIAANLHDESIGTFRNLHRADMVTTSTNVLF